MISSPQKRSAARAEQAKVVPGAGLGAHLDRGAWAIGGGRKAGEWRWLPALIGLVCVAVVLYVLARDPSTIVGATSGYALLLARGYWLNRRYLKRTGAG
jgi:hypothetical protein